MRRAAWLLPLALSFASLGLSLASTGRVVVYCSGFLMGAAVVLWAGMLLWPTRG